MSRVAALGALAGSLVLMAPCSEADMMPARGLVDSRIRTATYDADEVYRLTGYVGYALDIEFEPGEVFKGLAAGDIQGLNFDAQGNHLFLKPKAGGVVTNLTVLTDRRHYRFDYAVLTRAPDRSKDEIIYALRFLYPEVVASAEAAKSERAAVDEALRIGMAAENFNYWYCGPPSLRPLRAYDNGVHTWLEFGAATELPAVFLRNDDGSESLVNFSVTGTALIVHRIAARFILRRGNLVGCVENRGSLQATPLAPTGTISPLVKRGIASERGNEP
jgi:type IV secretion system protein VirB9